MKSWPSSSCNHASRMGSRRGTSPPCGQVLVQNVDTPGRKATQMTSDHKKNTASRAARFQKLSPLCALVLDTEADTSPRPDSATFLTSKHEPGAGKRTQAGWGGSPTGSSLNITENRARSTRHADQHGGLPKACDHTGWGPGKMGPPLLPRPFTNVTANQVTGLAPGPEPSPGGDRP